MLRPAGLDGDPTSALDLALGARAGVRLPLTPALAITLDAELQAPLRPLRLTVDDTPAWTASPLAPGAGLAIEWRP